MYQRKYCNIIRMGSECDWGVLKDYNHTWLVQTLLKVTNANVCASMVDGRSFFARRSGRASAERKSCGMNARDSRRMDDGPGAEEER